MVWLDVVTYLHHHGPSDPEEEVPWYRNEEWSYFRGGLSTIDRDYGAWWWRRQGEKRAGKDAIKERALSRTACHNMRCDNSLCSWAW